MSQTLSLCLSDSTCFCLHLSHLFDSVCLSVSVLISLSLLLCLSLYLSVCVSIFISLTLSVCLSVSACCLYLSVSLTLVCLSVSVLRSPWLCLFASVSDPYLSLFNSLCISLRLWLLLSVPFCLFDRLSVFVWIQYLFIFVYLSTSMQVFSFTHYFSPRKTSDPLWLNKQHNVRKRRGVV